MPNISLPIQLELSWNEWRYIFQSKTERIHYYYEGGFSSRSFRWNDSVTLGAGWKTFFGGVNLVNISGPWGDSWTGEDAMSPESYNFVSKLKSGFFKSAMVTYDAICTFRKKGNQPITAKQIININYDTSRKGWFLLGNIHSLSGISTPSNLVGGISYSATIANTPFVELITSQSPDDSNAGKGTYLWAKFEELNIPSILIQLPIDGDTVQLLTPIFSSSFADGPNESGIDPSSFKMILRGGLNRKLEVVSGDIGLSIGPSGFTYTPSSNLPMGLNTVEINISDNQGNIATSFSSFTVAIDTAPDIINLTPANGSILLQNGQPMISANFVDLGAGIDTAEFSFVIQGLSDNYFVSDKTTSSQGLTSLDNTGFVFKFPQNIIQGGLFKFEIRISDTDGNTRILQSEFSADYVPLNPNLSSLDILSLEKIGATAAVKLNAAGINILSDLVSASAFDLSISTGIKIFTIKDYIKRAKMVCSEARFKNEQFGELMSITITNLLKMTDAELLNYDIPVESVGELISLKDSIEILLVSLDDKELKNITLQDLVW